MSINLYKRLCNQFRVIFAPICLFLAAEAAFAQTTVTVNFAAQAGPPSHVGSGFLYGLTPDGTGPSDSLLLPLQCTLMRGGGAHIAGGGWIGDGYVAGAGFQARMNSALSQARRMTQSPYHATYDLLLSDVYGLDGAQPSNTVYPCDNGDPTNYVAFIDAVVAQVQASGVYVSYDIQNEPDGSGFWQRGIDSPQYFQMWNTAVREIRRLQPNAWIIGPSFSNFFPYRLNEWLSNVVPAGTLPNFFNWHFSDTPVPDGNTASGLLSSYGITGVGLSMNECIRSESQNAGYTAWYLTQLQKSNISKAAHAVWGNLYDGSLCQTLVNSGGAMQPTGQYWAMRRYGDLSGSIVSTGGNSAVDLIASTDSSSNRGRILLGSNTGFTGTATVNISGLNSTPYLMSNNHVQVVIERIPETGQNPLYNPVVIQSGLVTVNNGQISISISWSGSLDAYAVTLGPNAAGATNFTGFHTLTPMNAVGSRLDASGWGTANGTKVQIWQATNGSNQSWYFNSMGDGSFTLSPSYATGMCIDVSGFGTANGTLVQLWQSTGAINQKWIASPVSGNIYTFSPGNAIAKCLDVSGLGTANGTQVQIWQATGASNQQWQVN